MPTLNVPQAEFIQLPHKFRAFVAGFGSGKTWVGCSALCRHFMEWPGVNAGYFAPTYPQIRDIFYPTIDEVAFDWGLKTKVNQANHEVHLYGGRRYRGTVICRSMEKPQTIVGFKIGHALVDELDVLTAIKAQQAWRKIIARMRYKLDGLKNGVDVTTTPEGFKFVFQQFVKQLRQAYLRGQFVNLTSGTIYQTYNRKMNASMEVVEPGEPIFVGMDFNVGKMAAITHVKRLGLPHAVDEIVNAYDTPDMIRQLKERYWLYAEGQYKPTREIRIYPDASGDSRKSVNASETDIALLKQAGFKVIAPAANPPVKDRINAMNGMFCNAQQERRYRVNADKCPTYADDLEQQVWGANGEPDKSQGNDHRPDAGGYFIHKEYPIVKRTASSTPLRM